MLDAARARLAPAGREPRGVELRRRQHVGQGHGDRPHRARDPGHVGQGLGLRPRHDGRRSTSPALQARRGAAADRARRDERRGHGRLPRRAASSIPRRRAARSRRCCTRSSRRRTSTTRTPTASTCSPARADGERLVRGVLRRRRRLDPLHPARLHAVQAGRRGGARQPGPEARRARQARAGRVGRQRRGGLPAHDRGHQPGGRVRQRAHRRRGALRRPPRRPPTRARPELLQRAAAGDPRRGLERAAQAADRRHVGAGARVRLLRPRPSGSSPSARRAPTTSCTPSGCRCGSPTTRRPTTPTRCASGSPSGAEAFRDDYRAYVEAHARRGDRAGRPRPADRADPAPRAGRRRHDDEGLEALARPLPPRDRGDGRRRRRSASSSRSTPRRASRSSTGRSSSTSSRRRRRPASCRAGSRW